MSNSGKAPVSLGLGGQINGVGSISKIYWYNPATAGDTFTLTDYVTGALLWQGRCESANQSQEFQFGLGEMPFQGLIVSVLGSGTLYLTIE